MPGVAVREERVDERRTIAVLDASGVLRKNVAQALGVKRCTVSHWTNGRARMNPIYNEIATVRKLARGYRTDPWALATELIVITFEEHYKTWETKALIAEAWKLWNEEDPKDAAEDHAAKMRSMDREAWHRKGIDHSMHTIKLIAADIVLGLRGVDFLEHGVTK